MRDEPLYSFPARLDSLGAMATLLQSIAPACETTMLLRAETALEELLTNSIVHGQAAQLPSSSIWLAAYGKDDILHVAQSQYHDIGISRKLGMTNCWIERRHAQKGYGGTIEPENFTEPDYHVTAMAGLAEAVRQAGG